MSTLGLDHLQLGLYQFTLQVAEPMTLPAHKGAVLRGGFGITFRRSVCVYPHLAPCDDCVLQRSCPYPNIFEPSVPPDSEVLRTHSDVPLPFVLEPPEDHGTSYEPGEELRFRVVLIGRATAALPYFILTFQRLGEAGLGHDRARFSLHEVATLHPLAGSRTVLLRDGVFQREAREITLSATQWIADAGNGQEETAQAAHGSTSTTLTLHFRTPTRLKHADRFVEGPPPFHVVVRALLRRVSSLSYFYGGQRWEIDYRGWIERAEAVQIAQADVRWVDWERYSTRQERAMNLGGIVGQVTYADGGQRMGQRISGWELGGFLPLLRLGELVHVGKAAVFGNGRYEVSW